MIKTKKSLCSFRPFSPHFCSPLTLSFLVAFLPCSLIFFLSSLSNLFLHFSLSPRYISAHNTFFDKLFPSFFQLACCMILFFLSLPLDNFEISFCLRFSLSFNEYAFSSTTSSSLLSPTRSPPLLYSVRSVFPPKKCHFDLQTNQIFSGGGRSRERYEARWRSAVSSRIHIQ